MKIVVAIPHQMESELLAHLFQDKLEQGAFLFAEVSESEEKIRLDVRARYLVPPEGWEVQEEDMLVMKDSERAKIMKMARDMGLAAVDCHSHPRSGGKVSFSPSDRRGATEFAQYAAWKLGRKPFVTMVWGESLSSLWYGEKSRSTR